MARKIYVGRISSTTTDKHLHDHFSQIGKVVSAKVVLSINPQKNAGYGYIVMSNDKETEDAIGKLNNSKLEGSSIRVIEAHSFDQERNSYPFWKSYRRHR